MSSDFTVRDTLRYAHYTRSLRVSEALLAGTVIPTTPLDSIDVARNEWILGNRELVERFLAVMREANAYVGTHEAETLPLIAGFLSRDPSTLAQMVRPARPADVDPAELQPVIALAAHYQLITKPFPAQQLICPPALAPARAPQRR